MPPVSQLCESVPQPQEHRCDLITPQSTCLWTKLAGSLYSGSSWLLRAPLYTHDVDKTVGAKAEKCPALMCRPQASNQRPQSGLSTSSDDGHAATMPCLSLQCMQQRVEPGTPWQMSTEGILDSISLSPEAVRIRKSSKQSLCIIDIQVMNISNMKIKSPMVYICR